MMDRGIRRGPTGRPLLIRKAAKDYPADGIKKGQPYWRWQYPGRPLHRSLAKPAVCPHCGRAIGIYPGDMKVR